jgi:molecular chaperone GrpE (heat shock protein)
MTTSTEAAQQAMVKVEEGLRRDTGTGVARLDETTRRTLGLEDGQAIEIVGNRRTAARLGVLDEMAVAPILRADGLIRRNAGIALGETVTVRRAHPVPAERLVLAPVMVEGFRAPTGQKATAAVTKWLRNQVLAPGDVLVMPGIGLLGSSQPYRVQFLFPDAIVAVNERTSVEVGDEPVREDGTAWIAAGAEIASLRDKLETAEKEALYLQAEVQNAHKVAERERVEYAAHAAEEVLRKLLPALDELEAAVQSLPEDHARGVSMVQRNLLHALEDIGLRVIPAQGVRFDPFRHEAADVVTDSELEDGTIAKVLRTGYIYNLKVLRPALVAVAKRGGTSA